MEINGYWQESEEEIRVRQFKSRVAKKILLDPDVMQILDEMKQDCHTAFSSMTYGAKIEEYQAVHFSLMAIDQFIAKLEGYVIANEVAEKNEEVDKKMEGVQI